MAEQIPYAIAKGLISNLASWAFGEIGRIPCVEDDLRELKDKLELIQAVLSDAEERQHEDLAVQIWIRRLKEVVHHADNLFADLLMHDLRHKVSKDNTVEKVRRFFSSENSLLVKFFVARQIKEIKEKCNKVAEDMSGFNPNRTVVIHKNDELAWRETSSYVMQSEIIGREENKNDIMNLLNQTQTNQNVSLVAIVGTGGLGKTALAQVVYNDDAVQKHFEKKIWVCISEDFEVKSVLNKMLKSLRNVEFGQLGLDQLQKMLQEQLSGQRYLLVLDDVWNESQLKWNDLRNYLMCGGEGSKILVTTRSTIVSKIMGIESPYVLKGITKEQSWSLLKNLAFGNDPSKMSPTLESIGERIAEKCGGVPLAIRTIGGFLGTINEESDQWESILNDDIWRLSKERESIMPVLKLSYQKLPLGLRQCFAYCYLYPKDSSISKNELIQSWMALGYLETSTGTMEDMGNQYIRDLLMRSFFQEACMDEHGGILYFKMHDLMHDLAKSIVGNDCYLDSDGKGIAGRPMHVALHSNTICLLELLDASHLRTIICHKIDAMINPSFMKSLTFLRVLNFSFSSITQLPESIDNIKYLKCLNLSFCYELVSLPKSIGNLVCLQTLDLTHCLKLDFSPEIIVKLINLRHLGSFLCKALKGMVPLPVGLGKLTSLQTLRSFFVGDSETCKSAKLNELKELNNITGEIWIGNLGLVNDVASESQETNLQAKKHIRRLFLDWGKEEENKNSDSLELLDNLRPSQNLKNLFVFNYPGVRFSGWLSSLTSIVEISLRGFPNCQYLPPLERLPCLKELYISEMRELKCIYYEEISNVFFPYLERLGLHECWNLRGWQRLGDDNVANNIDGHLSLPPFPRLYSFRMGGCPNLICKPTVSYDNSVK